METHYIFYQNFIYKFHNEIIMNRIFLGRQNILKKADFESGFEKCFLKIAPTHFVQWYVQAACATQGTGLYEGLDWLSAELSK